MVILGGAGPVHDIGREAFQEVDQMNIMRPPVQVPASAHHGRPVPGGSSAPPSARPCPAARAPVYIDCGADVLYEEIEESDAGSPHHTTRSAAKPAADPASHRRGRRPPSQGRAPHESWPEEASSSPAAAPSLNAS